MGYKYHFLYNMIIVMKYYLEVISVLIFGLYFILYRSSKQSNDRQYVLTPSVHDVKKIHYTVSYVRPWGGASRSANSI